MVNDRTWTLLTRKLSGEASATEQEELDNLLSHEQLSPQAIEQLTNIWNEHHSMDEEFLEATYLQHLERIKDKGIEFDCDNNIEKKWTVSSPVKRPVIFGKLLLGAACLVIFICSWWIIASTKPSRISPAKLKTPSLVVAKPGARTKILLPDGSGVWLNSGSKIEYNKDFSKGLREVQLTGEAFFDVVKDLSRPFIIHTAKIDVKVLGTRFNVKAYENDATTETSLIKGSVEVFLKNNPSEKFLLKPNKKLVLQNNPLPSVERPEESPNFKESPIVEIKELTYINGTQSDVETSWTKNILSFEDESFLNVAHKMERWYDVSFEFRNKKWQQQYLSGSFENETIEQAMAALRFSNGFSYSIQENKVIVY